MKSTTVRISKAGQAPFLLQEEFMIERTSRDLRPYYLHRATLAMVLSKKMKEITFYLTGSLNRHFDSWYISSSDSIYVGKIREGRTQRNKKFLQIGCKRFVGENRTRLIRWAMSYKSK